MFDMDIHLVSKQVLEHNKKSIKRYGMRCESEETFQTAVSLAIVLVNDLLVSISQEVR